MDRPQVLILGQDPNLVRPVRAALQNSLIVHLVHIHTEQASNPSCSIMRISKDSARARQRNTHRVTSLHWACRHHLHLATPISGSTIRWRSR